MYAKFLQIVQTEKRVPPVHDRGLFRNKLIKPAEPPKYNVKSIAEGEVDLVMTQRLHYDLDEFNLNSTAVLLAPKTTRLMINASKLQKRVKADLMDAAVVYVNKEFRLVLDAQLYAQQDGLTFLLAETPSQLQTWLAQALEEDSPALALSQTPLK